MATQSVEERLRALEDEREITHTLFQYGHTLDYGPEEEFLDVFVEDCLFHTLPTPREMPEGLQAFRRFEGKEAMRQFFRGHSHAPEYYHKHLALEPRIRIEGDVAKVVSYLVRLDEHPEGPYVRVLGRYHDQLVRCPDGRWRIKDRQAQGEAFHQRLMKHTPTPWLGMPPTIR